MNVKLQVLLAISLILGAVGVVWVLDGDETLSEESAGTDHSSHGAVGGGDAKPVRLTEEARDRIGMTLAIAEMRPLDSELRSVGWVSYDETRLYSVTPKIGGWIERLWVDFTGAPVRKGEPLLEIYSPELVVAQEELVLARRLMDDLQATSGPARRDAEELLISSRRRLEYWDISDEDIRQIESSGEVRKTMVLRAPESGLVVEKHVLQGDHIKAGTTLFRVADLSHIWIEADIFERDLGLVSIGLHVELTVEAFPGRRFTGSVTYVYPTVAMGSRTGRIRVELANPGLDLKPGMYADLRILLPDPGSVLTIPTSSVLSTGERSVVFRHGSDGVLYPTEIQVGRRSGDFVEVISGLSEGDQVVSSANFLIDAESNLGAAMAGMGGMDGDRSDMGGEEGLGEAPMDTTMNGEPGKLDHSGHLSGGN